jgi:hypothetical protein
VPAVCRGSPSPLVVLGLYMSRVANKGDPERGAVAGEPSNMSKPGIAR